MELSYFSLTGTLVKRIIRETLRGKTLARIFLNHTLAEIAVTGTILDLGSSSESASYHRFLRYEKPYQITHTDFYQSAPGIVQLDMERPFTLPDNRYDAVTCFNALEHVYNYNGVMAETFRVLKIGGSFVGGTPFLVNYHADPHDYFRYTHEAIARMLVEAGFRVERVVALGLGPCTVAAEFVNRVLPRVLRALIACGAASLDRFILRLRPAMRGQYALGYVWVAKK